MGFGSFIKNTVGTVLGTVGGVVGTALDMRAQANANKTNIELANTAVQRRAKDLEAAGFNRLLAANGQAAAVPNVNPVMTGDKGKEAALLALQMKSLEKDNMIKDKTAEGIDLDNQAKALDNNLNARFKESERTLNLLAQKGNINESKLRQDFLKAQTTHERAKILYTTLMQSSLEYDIKKKIKDIEYIDAQTKMLEFELGLEEKDPDNKTWVKWTKKIGDVFDWTTNQAAKFVPGGSLSEKRKKANYGGRR